MNITSAGIGSGLDLEGIIEAYINAEAIPTEVRLQKKEDRLNTELSGVGQFKSALSGFDSVINKLKDLEDFNKQNIDVSSEDISVVTNGYASNGSFAVEVHKLATSSKQQSTLYTDSSTAPGAGTLSFGDGTDNFSVSIDATDSLSNIRDKINEQSDNFGITVSVINTGSNSYLTFTSDKTGSANELSITSGDAALSGMTTANNTILSTADDAQIEIDGNGILINSDTNEFKNTIEDVTITANTVNVGSPATLDISQDDESASDLINNFVNNFNSLISVMDDLSNPETGDLAFDPNIRSLKSQLTSIVTGSISSGTGGIDSLDDIGITLNRDGKLEISPLSIGSLPSGTEKLSSALENDLNNVGELFASTDGVTTQLQTLIESYNGSDGTLTERKSLLSAEIKGIAGEYEALETKLRNYEDTLRTKFTFLDSTVSYYNATSNWLTSALKLPTSNND